jgi:hypothetical protein
MRHVGAQWVQKSNSGHSVVLAWPDNHPGLLKPIRARKEFAAAPFRLGPIEMFAHVTFRIAKGDIHYAALPHPK